MTVHLFVYGTLMRRARHPMAAMLAANADFVGEGRYAGRLYMISHYPGVVPSTMAGDVVFGDVYVLRHPSRLLRRLDVYEGSGPLSQKPVQYVRRLQTIALGDGKTLEAFVYVYNRPIAGLTRIRSGRFLRP
ncbi:gamma-glutamylcyclotransferase family protein [Bradyrhizobium prioriisuperbiae]|uniref:gamma-glutamylcyclotransferase family protein n=1 Tax=Bradyrhizobium prioriisuperbiae TaxID=2854389 RepID=UPI0028E49400|nr:gamma-glutamylcyclotransferase family protein [Bradyrhizobium prioritasuperba]